MRGTQLLFYKKCRLDDNGEGGRAAGGLNLEERNGTRNESLE